MREFPCGESNLQPPSSNCGMQHQSPLLPRGSGEMRCLRSLLSRPWVTHWVGTSPEDSTAGEEEKLSLGCPAPRLNVLKLQTRSQGEKQTRVLFLSPLVSPEALTPSGCIHTCTRVAIGTMMPMWNAMEDLKDSGLCFHHVGPRDRTQVLSLGDKCLYLLSHSS